MERRAHTKTGLTLIEMTLVIATIALLVGFALPAVRALRNSFESEGSVKAMIGGALSYARATAVKNQCYTGVRFQMACTSKDASQPLDGLLNARQYMVFIERAEPEEMGGLTIGFRAVAGMEPVKLPEMIGVIDVREIAGDGDIDTFSGLNDAVTFSVVFSPSGKLVVHDVRTRNRDGVYQPDNGLGDSDKTSNGDVFNSPENICTHGRGRFIQDDYSEWGLSEEQSRTGFVVYDRQDLPAAFKQGTLWSGYLSSLAEEHIVYVSPYTGALIATE
jgi:hypothetical protein